MARLARVVLPGTPHHVTQRGVRRQETFFNDDDYGAYLKLMAESCKQAGTQVWAWCLMPNHVHLVLVPSQEDGLRAAIAETHRRYTRRINERQKVTGHLWQERFHSFPMDEPYLLAAVRYVERNPVKAGLAKSPEKWPWSSAVGRLDPGKDPLSTPDALAGMISDWPAFWKASPDEGDDKALDSIRRHTRTGRPLGNERFISVAEKRTGRTLKLRRGAQ